ncbi:MAG: AraC family transcriptional regulator [Thermoleophilia bacterium]
MDEVSALLDGPRARGAFVLRARFEPPWALRIADEAPLAVIAVVRGGMAISDADGPPVLLGRGDVAVVRGPEPYILGDAPGTAPQAVILPGQRCMSPDGRTPVRMRDLGHRTWGSAQDGSTALLTGVYETPTALGGRLLRALPRLAVLRAGTWECAVLGILDEEAARDRPGQDAVLDRLLDVLLVSALRAWFARPGSAAPAWFRAQEDPVAADALRRIHDDPARAWTLAVLARECGVSRAALARRFTARIGEPPMRYLTGWRIALAADLLADPGATLASVAPRVGYATGFSLSEAFLRVTGRRPSHHRAAHAA